LAIITALGICYKYLL